jgi:hypothetical protein
MQQAFPYCDASETVTNVGHGVLRCINSILSKPAAAEVGISAESGFCFPTEHLGKQKICANFILYMLRNDQRFMHVLLSTTHNQCGKRETHSWTTFSWWETHTHIHSFEPGLKKLNAEQWCIKRPLRKQGAMLSTDQRLMLYHCVLPCTTINDIH